MKYGLHVATAGDFFGIPSRGRAAGGSIVQIFAGNPRGWQQRVYEPADGEKWQLACADNQIEATFIHMLYLTSYGSPDDSLRGKSIAAYAHTLRTADTLGAVGVVTHLGSHKGAGFESCVQPMADGLVESLEGGSQTSFAILENSAGAGDNMGNTLEELAEILKRTNNHPRIRFCIDTCHALTSGYEIRTKDGLEAFLDKFDKLIGLDRLAVMHLNDSKFDIGAHRDRHENIGDGFIGNDGWKVILNNIRLADIPGVLEVPGLDGKGPDKPNLDRLVKLTG